LTFSASQTQPNTALHLTAYSLHFAVLRSGFRRQVSLGVRAGQSAVPRDTGLSAAGPWCACCPPWKVRAQEAATGAFLQPVRGMPGCGWATWAGRETRCCVPRRWT